MLTLLYARAGHEVRQELLERMGRSAARRRLLIVPEQYSHESERHMCRVLGNGASARNEVLSFTRLAGRVADVAGGGAAPVLDGGGRLLLMYAALRQAADSLSLYRSPSRKPAFLTGLLTTVDECRSYCVRPEELIRAGEELGGQQGDKVKDIGLIYAAYEALSAEAAADPRSRLDRLAEQLKDTQWGDGLDVYVHGFTDFTPQEERVLEELARQGSLTVALTKGEGDDPSGVFGAAQRAAWRLKGMAKEHRISVTEETLCRTRKAHPALRFLEENLFGALPAPWEGECAITRVAAGDRRLEVEWAAAETLRLMREEGYRCRDIALCATQWSDYGELVDSIFPRYGIPVFRSVMEDVLRKPVLALVTSALAAVAEDYPYEEMFRYLKTDLTGISREERDLLENYVLTWNIRGGTWMREKPWDMHPEGYGLEFKDHHRRLVERLDGIRRRVIEPLEKLRRHPDKTGRGRAEALYDMLEAIGLPGRLARRAESMEERGDLNGAAQYRQLWDILVGGLEQCALLLADRELEAEEFSRLFSMVLSQYDVGAIPVSLDRVAAGDASRMVHKEAKVLFFLGADSNSVPKRAPEASLLSEQDREALAAVDVELAPGQEDRLRREMTVVYQVCALPTERLYLSYAVRGAEGDRAPCFLWERLKAMFPGQPPVTAEGRACALSAPLPALELAGSEKELADLLKRDEALAPRVERLESVGDWKRGSLSQQAVRKLFGPEVPMSATRLDLYNSCHFSHFLRFGLDARPRERAAFNPSEYGTFIHAVLEEVLGWAKEHGGVGELARSEELRHELVRQAADRYEKEELAGLEGETARFRQVFYRMKQSARAVTDSVVAELAVSDFDPVRFELGFGRNQELPPVEVSNGVTLRLSGFVDRVDQWVHEGKRYLRVVDYKTGKKAFQFSDVEDGRGLQMLLYLFALTRHGEIFGPEEVVPAGVLYVPARNPLISGDRDMPAEEVRDEQWKQLRRKGLVLDDPAVLAAMEKGEGKSRFLPDRAEYKVTPEQLELLDEYVTDTLNRAAGQMAEGVIDADPYWHDGETNACRYCKYQAACHFEECCGDRVRYRKGISGREFWQWLERRKEGEQHGN